MTRRRRAAPRAEPIVPGQSVMVRRAVGAAWERAVYVKKFEDWRGYHRVKLTANPRRIDMMTGMETDEANPRSALCWTMSIPSVRLRRLTDEEQAEFATPQAEGAR